VFVEGCHESCCGSWPSFAQKNKLYLAPFACGMWIDLGEQQGSQKEQEVESQTNLKGRESSRDTSGRVVVVLQDM
jgi:hypothetical protein